jgi:hypothetical protein
MASEIDKLRQYFLNGEIADILAKNNLVGSNIGAQMITRSLDSCNDLRVSETQQDNSTENMTIFREALLRNNFYVFRHIAPKIPSQNQIYPWFTWFVDDRCDIPMLRLVADRKQKQFAKILIDKGFIPTFKIGTDAISDLSNEMQITYDNFSNNINFILDCDYAFENNLLAEDLHNFMALLEPKVLHRFLSIINLEAFSIDDCVHIIENISRNKYYLPITYKQKSTTSQILSMFISSTNYANQEILQRNFAAILRGQTKMLPSTVKHIWPINTRHNLKRETKFGLTKLILKPTSLKMQIYGSVF